MYTEKEPKDDPTVESEIVLATKEQVADYKRVKGLTACYAKDTGYQLFDSKGAYYGLVVYTKLHKPYTDMIMAKKTLINADIGLINLLGMQVLAD